MAQGAHKLREQHSANDNNNKIAKTYVRMINTKIKISSKHRIISMPLRCGCAASFERLAAPRPLGIGIFVVVPRDYGLLLE